MSDSFIVWGFFSSAVIRKAHKTTKVTGDGEKDLTDKSNDVLVPDYKFSTGPELKIDDHFRRKIDEAASLIDKTANENKQPILTATLPLSHRERRQKIKDEAFGKASNTQHDQVLGEQYFSHTVNLEDTRRKIHESEKAQLKLQEQRHIDGPLIPDNRSQYGIFKMSRELNVTDDNHDEIIVTHSAPTREPDLSKNLENVKGTAEETPLVEEPNLSQAKEDFDKCVNNPESIERKALCNDDAETIEVIKDERKPDLYQKAIPAEKPHLPWFLNATNVREPKLTRAKEDVNDNQESVEKKQLYNRPEYGLFKMSRELNVKDDSRDEIVVTDSAPARESDLSKNLENVKGTAEETPLVEEPKLSQAKEDFDKCVNNPESIERKAICNDDAETIEVIKDERKSDLYQKATLADKPHLPWFLNATNVREPKLPRAKEDINDNHESVEKKTLFKDDVKTIKLVKKTHDLHEEATPTDQPHTPRVLNTTTAKEEDELLTQKLETIEETPVVEAHKPKIEGFNVTDLYQKATPADNPHLPWFLNATNVREPKLPRAKENVNDNQESVEKIPLCKDDVKTIKLVKNERTHDLHGEATPTDQPHTPRVLNTTTAKEEEELLTQKLETIEETPVVEAHKPKLEGFNVTPRVLGNEPTFNSKIIENNQDKSFRLNLPATIDEVSKRCLKCPLGQIDEMLINEMEKLGLTYNAAHKAPSTPMEDDLVQMEVLNKQPIGTIEEHEMLSESTELEKENERATDSRIPEENEQAEAIRKSEAIIKPTEEDVHDILYPEHTRIQLEPLSCKTEEYNPADDYNSPTKFACYYLPATFRAEKTNKQEIEEAIRYSRVPKYNQIKGPLSETPNSHAFINNRNAETYSVQSVEGHVLAETVQSAQTESAAAEAETTSAEDINTTIASVDPLQDGTLPDNIRQERFLKPEYSTYFKGFSKPSNYATINASKSVVNETRTQALRQFDKNSFYSGNLTTVHVWGHAHNASASKYENVHQSVPKQTDDVEHYGKTPTRQSTEVQGELEQKQTTANRLYENVPYTNLRLPGENCNKKIDYSPTADKITQQCLKPEGHPEKASLTEEILKEHTLDPCYVLTCNETCPISPGSSMSASQKNCDFVDTTETLYMKQNICETVRPKPQPIAKSANMSSDTHARPNVLDMKNQPDIRCTSMPDAIESMPKLGEQMTLSALLRKVREKSRTSNIDGQSRLDVQAVGKCGSKSPRCPPIAPRAPPTDRIPLPTFGLPKLKRAPPVCKPIKKPSNKCSSCTSNDGGICPVMPYVLDEAEVCAVMSKVNLTDEVIESLQNLGNILGVVLRQTTSDNETLLARDYEPWTPIPSWKIPQKTENNKWRPGMHGVPPCVDGCPVFPKARATMNPEPPCNLKPCEGFPKRTSFSMLDCFTVSLGENKVYDLGDF